MAAPLKTGLAKPAIGRLADNIHRASPEFERRAFLNAAMRGLGKLELKERVGHVANVLRRFLPDDYADAVEIIVAAGETWDRGDENDPLRGFAAWPLFHLIEHYGVDDFDRSMGALRSITHLFSAEFALRPFLARYPKRAFRELARWTKDPDEHVRRLVSECTRPRLPWATRVPGLIDDPTPVLALLEKLKNDPVLYVRRSVANNLNDIAKDHPDRVIDVCEIWMVDATPERRWIVERATRTLVKAGHPRVWGLLGYTKRPRVEMSSLRLSKKRVRVGQSIELDFTLTSTAKSEQRLVVDYAVHFMKASGQPRPKVFKLKTLNLGAGDSVRLSRKQSFREISTRTYHPGRHAIEILVNGAARARAEFDLVA